MVFGTGDSGQSGTDARLAQLELKVAELERRLQSLEAGVLGTSGTSATEVVADEVDPWSVPPWPQIVDLVRRGRTIEAIRQYRASFGTGLAEAKSAIDEVERRLS